MSHLYPRPHGKIDPQFFRTLSKDYRIYYRFELRDRILSLKKSVLCWQ